MFKRGMWVFVVLFVSIVMYAYCKTARAEVALSYPPQMSAWEIALADIELLPENVNKTFVALASDYGQKMPEEAVTSGVYAEFGVQHYLGKVHDDSFTGTTLYVEVPLSAEDYSLWGTLYHDKLFQGVYAGLAKKFGNLQVALGAGTVRDDGVRMNVINPWVFYSSDEYEALLHAEHYSNKSDEPWFYKGYVQKKISDELFVGVYGEKDLGIGPIVTWKVAKGVKLWVTIPVAQKPEEGQLKLLVGVKFIYE